MTVSQATFRRKCASAGEIPGGAYVRLVGSRPRTVAYTTADTFRESHQENRAAAGLSHFLYEERRVPAKLLDRRFREILLEHDDVVASRADGFARVRPCP